MKSVGEAMAIGRSFAESLQKALRSMETGLTGLNEVVLDGEDKPTILAQLAKADAGPPAGHRRKRCAKASPSKKSSSASKFDPWFIRQVEDPGEDRKLSKGPWPAADQAPACCA